MKIRIIAISVLLFLVVVFAVQNAAIVETEFLFWQIDLPRWVLIFGVLIVGVIIGWFYRGIIRAIAKREK